ncbi:MAG: DUF4040 domain-containing protein [Cyanobacteria bacterium P01_C01_bin.73]
MLQALPLSTEAIAMAEALNLDTLYISDNLYIAAIALLLPVTAAMVVTQTNPYHALIIRGILGAVAALVYALFGAADVALTEALVGTMLSITLYAIAVRSSLRFRLGVLTQDEDAIAQNLHLQAQQQTVFDGLQTALSKHYLRLEQVPYDTAEALHTALQNKDIHGIATLNSTDAQADQPVYRLQVGVQVLCAKLDSAVSPDMAEVLCTPMLALDQSSTDPALSAKTINHREEIA